MQPNRDLDPQNPYGQPNTPPPSTQQQQTQPGFGFSPLELQAYRALLSPSGGWLPNMQQPGFQPFVSSPQGFQAFASSPHGFVQNIHQTQLFQSAPPHSEPEPVPETQGEPESVPETQPPAPSRPRKRSHKKKAEEEKATEKKVNVPWTPEEEEALMISWLFVSEDPKKGTAQNHSSFWNRVNENFHKHLKREPYRANDSLTSKWGSMGRRCSLFNSLYNNAKNRRRSGEDSIAWTNYAHQEFQARDGKPFTHIKA